MNFESRVLDVVAKVIPMEQYAKFTAGTLFVECTPREASKLESALIEALACGVIVSPIEGEFAFDFTA